MRDSFVRVSSTPAYGSVDPCVTETDEYLSSRAFQRRLNMLERMERNRSRVIATSIL